MGRSARAAIRVDSTALISVILMRSLRLRFTFSITSGAGAGVAFTRACGDLLQPEALLVTI